MTDCELRKVLGENVKARRIELGMTQMELAEALGFSRPRISQLEAGYNSLPVDLLAKLSVTLRCTPAALVTEGSFAPAEVHA